MLDSGVATGGGGGTNWFDRVGDWIDASSNFLNQAGQFLSDVGKVTDQVTDAANQVTGGINDLVNSVGGAITAAGQLFGVGGAGEAALKGRQVCLVGGVPIQVVEVENPLLTAKATRYALENGEPITDHVMLNPFQIKVRGIWASDNLKHRLYYEALKQAWRRRQLVPYISGMEVRGNMAIVNLSPMLKDKASNAYFVDITLQQIKMAEAGESATQGNDPGTGATPEQPTTDGGNQSPGEEEPQDGSVLWRLWQMVGGEEK